MATSILDKYGIKEVADVMFYELDKKGAPSAPVLYLDTLKVSTLSQSSELVDATGGKGNVKLLTWDTNKELTLELEDALFSAKSLQIMFGGSIKETGSTQEVLKTLRNDKFKATTISGVYSFELRDMTFYIDVKKVAWFYYATDANTGAVEITPIAITSATTEMPANADFGTFDLLDATTSPTGTTGMVAKGVEIDITAEFGDNTYYITGDTFARNAASGKDEFLQFIVPKGKVSAEDVSLTMEADGDPATFSMTVNCLKSEEGALLKLVKYEIAGSGDTGNVGLNKGVASVLDEYNDNTTLRAPWSKPSARIPGTSKNDNTNGSDN